MKTEHNDNRLGISGSFVIAAIGSDGIILASESRANIFDRNDHLQSPIAYYDTIQKVFPKENFAVAETGQGVIANVFFSSIIEDFYQKLESCEPKDVLKAFIEYVNKFVPKEIQQELFRQKLFSGGYFNSEPTICYFNNVQQPNFGCITDGFIQSDKTIFGDSYSINMTCQELSDLAVSSITEYASHHDRWKTIGGPISVLKIIELDTEWILNEPECQRWKYVNEFKESIKRKEVNISLVEPNTIEDLHKTFGI
ncbi:MAG: hypothetical protein JKX73_11725 [Flavobacteriales bacterium]|nr:hypothetical protein [Flavobacteriales bacterium]